MDKFLLQKQVLERLAEDLLQAEQAMRAAHETATPGSGLQHRFAWDDLFKRPGIKIP